MAVLLAVPAVLQLRGGGHCCAWQAGTVVVYGVVAIAGGELVLASSNAIESIPIGLAVLLEYLGVVLIVGWLWAVRGQRPGGARRPARRRARRALRRWPGGWPGQPG